MRKSSTRFSHLFKSFNLFTSDLFFHSINFVLLGLLLLSPLSSLSHSRLTFANRSFYYSAPVLFYGLPPDLRHVAHHATSSPTFNSPVSDPSTWYLFLIKLNTHLFHCSFFLSMYHIGYFRTDIYGNNHTSLFHIVHSLLSFTRVSFMLIV